MQAARPKPAIPWATTSPALRSYRQTALDELSRIVVHEIGETHTGTVYGLDESGSARVCEPVQLIDSDPRVLGPEVVPEEFVRFELVRL